MTPNAAITGAEGGHEYYGMAFYSPPWSDRMGDIEAEWKARLKRLQAEFDAYRNNAETAVKQALRQYDDEPETLSSNDLGIPDGAAVAWVACEPRPAALEARR